MQLVLAAKSPAVLSVKFSDLVVSLSVSLSVLATLVVPTVSALNDRDESYMVRGLVPVPVMLMTCGLVTASS